MHFKSRFGALYITGMLMIITSMLLRSVLLFKVWPQLDADPLLVGKIYATGFIFDCITFGYMTALCGVYAILAPDRWFNNRVHAALVYACVFITAAVLYFDAAAEYLFFDEFGTRFNFIAVDYLVYTREVIGNIRESYPVNAILAVVLLFAALTFASTKKYIGDAFRGESRLPQRVRAGAVFVALPLLALPFVDLSLTTISKNDYANELAGNGIYDLFSAFRNNELDYGRFYASGDEGKILLTLRDELQERNNRFVSGDFRDMTRVVSNNGREKRLNVIVIIEESMSASFLGVFGNTGGLTPNLDKLARESLFFTHHYATGTRTVRGLEAITLSLPPLPGISIVKRPDNKNYFSWGSVMRSRGYDTKYIYAGFGYFDNMNDFFSGNNFDIVDRGSFSREEITFSNVWGVCDEDLFAKVISESGKSHAARKPFFSMVMTTSNHRPFTYPEGRIDIPSETGRNGGIKYADYALGQFLEKARVQPWFRDTIIVVVADHCAGSAGKTELPVDRYRVPLMVYAPAHITPRRVDAVVSQVDIAPTVLGLLNFSYSSRFMGHDALKIDAGQERAFISTYQKLGFIKDNTLVVLGPKRSLRTYAVDLESGKAVESAPDEHIVDEALGYFQGESYLYAHRLNRIQPSEVL